MESENDLERESNKGDGDQFDRLYKQGAKPKRQKIVDNAPDILKQTIKKATLKAIKDTVPAEQLERHRKTTRVQGLMGLEYQAEVVDRLSKIKIKDDIVKKVCDTHIISAKTMETLFQYFDLTPTDTK